MEIRRRSLPPLPTDDVSAPRGPTLSIALSIPLPVAWPRRPRDAEPGLPEDFALTCLELAFGERQLRPSLRPQRRVGRRRAVLTAPLHEAAGASLPSPSFAVAMRQGGWWQVALARLKRRARRLQVVRLLSL